MNNKFKMGDLLCSITTGITGEVEEITEDGYGIGCSELNMDGTMKELLFFDESDLNPITPTILFV